MGAAAPGILVAQAVGRVGNYFNQELFGGPTTLPWALRIDPGHRPDGYERYATFHPTFLYELIFDLALAGALVWLGRRREIRAPGLFALYVAGYSGFRIFEEQLRIDPRTTSSHRVEPSAGVVRRLRRARHRPALGRHPRPGRGAARHRGDPAPDGRTVCLADCADRLRRGLRRIPGDHQHADDPGRHGVRARRAADRLLGLQLPAFLRRRDRPVLAGKLAEHVSVGSPFYLGAAMTASAVVVLWAYRGALRPVDVATPAPAPSPTRAGAGAMVVAVAGATARQVSAMAVPLARARGQAVHVVNVIETDVLAGEDTAELETGAEANALLDACIGELRAAGVPVSGELLHSYGTHIDVARQILRRAADLRAGAIVLGPDTHQTPANDVSAYVAGHAPCHVIVINPRAGALGRPMPAATPAS
jgi:nucleotide-binding universal stress UspA family protein